ncbi:glutathione S-transferase family protein [Leptospira sp. GIMC2001]|uniref:glutathione S-transferase family protein n=1 Tax=Leptospira sp. GIMC2001 TaxID=1513297 RepID=UPI00234A1CF1|nr:glutathione S-transferase family protein [Leptospira sp. GIMC2001]WCL51142.1 glutathione S-transferase family protein [Leptospira sp. GIMC2001]
MSKPKLISFKLCPYVQRSVITLKEKNVDFDIEYIDLSNKPDWFLKISPLGKVPVLQTNGEVLFESAVINEYLDEIYKPALHPQDPLLKAKNRAWIEFSSGILVDQYMLAVTKEESVYNKTKESILSKLNRLEEILPDIADNDLFFNGNQFSLADSSVAPLLQRFRFIELHSDEKFILTPKLLKWTESLLRKNSVLKSLLPEVPKEYIEYIIKQNSYLANKLVLSNS